MTEEQIEVAAKYFAKNKKFGCNLDEAFSIIRELITCDDVKAIIYALTENKP